MLNKLQFNNLVISNKKGIQQSRIQTINKLVHKIRKLKTLLEKRPEDDKCKDRIRKSTESMEVLKKFKRVELVKNVLLLEKPPAAVITNGLSTPDEIAVALLAMNNVMQSLIKRFKKELKLTDDTDGKWREELKENSKRSQKFERTEQKKMKRTALKEQKALEHKRKEWLEQNFENVANTEEVLDAETEISTVGVWKVEETEVGTEATKSNTQTQPPQKLREKKVKNKKDAIIGNSRKEEKQTPHIKRTADEEVNIQKPNKKQKKEDGKLKKITKFHDNESPEEETSLQQNDIAVESDNDDDPTETHVVDPFFVTDTGENYLSTAVINRNNNQLGNNGENTQKDLHMVKLSGSKKHTNFRDRKHEESDRRPQQSNWANDNEGGTWKRRDRRQNQQKNQWANNNDRKPWQKGNDNNDKKFKQNNWAHNTDKAPQKHNQDQFPKNAKVKMNKPSSNAKTDEKLHPSWAAKQKQKPIITGFQGKKIIFGDDGVENAPSKTTPSQNNKTFNRKDTSAAPNLKTDSLHPSWVAKQKQKPTIAAFQGKKITFDNAD